MRRLLATLVLLLVPTLALAGESSAFPKGTFTLHTQVAVTDDIEATGYIIPSAAVGAGWYVENSFAIGVEVGGYGFLQGDNDDTFGPNLAGFLRHHFIDRRDYSIYFDVFFGPIYTDAETPGGGTHFNYLTRLGIGMTRPLDERLDLMGGIRWFHLSNGYRHGEDQNPALNGLQYYVGLMWRW